MRQPLRSSRRPLPTATRRASERAEAYARAPLVIRHLNNGGPSTSKNRFETFLEDRFGSYANASYAARQVFDAVPVPASPVFLGYRTILLGWLTPATTVGSFTATEREAVGIAFADRLQTLS